MNERQRTVALLNLWPELDGWQGEPTLPAITEGRVAWKHEAMHYEGGMLKGTGVSFSDNAIDNTIPQIYANL